MGEVTTSQPTKHISDEVKIIVTWGGRGKYEIALSLDETVAQLKEEIEKQSSA